MDYFSFHISDFISATNCLTPVEQSFYMRSILFYYDTEKPLTKNKKILFKRLSANTDEEKGALETVLELYFVEEEDCFRHARCDEEISKYHAKHESQIKAGKASARSRRKNKQSKNEQNLTDVEHTLNRRSTYVEQTFNQPITNNQEPITNKEHIRENPDGIIHPLPVVQKLKNFEEPEKPKEPKPEKNSVPFKKIVSLYHSILDQLPQVEKLTDVRKGLIRQRWTQDLQSLDEWENYFNYVKRSDFLMGRVAPRDDRRPFRADLEWLIRPSNYTKIAEEKYHHGQI